ncbi:MAG TPA: M48 family metalloprotease [Vicinamibacterales bacterium]|nr:M48 family metalloprotease [Vicinamibacterales bacterium]
MTIPLAQPFRLGVIALVLAASVSSAAAQTQITLDKNKYTPAQDVQIGQEAVAEVRRELPMLNDQRADAYVERIGRDLVRAIPQQFQQDGFRYSFDVVNQKEINAFALPGGPMFLHRGMIEAAKSEAEVAGVMAHEISHVALRHGTAQATKGQKFQIGSIAGQILGAIVGGAAGSVISQGSQFGLGAYFMKYGREYERQADLLGAQILARAGYDPRRMADMFRTIEQQSGGRGGGPEWLSSHPNPGNRYDAILKESEMLQVASRNRSEADFQAVQSRFRSMQPAYTAEQIARAKQNGGRLPSGQNTGRDDRDDRDRDNRDRDHRDRDHRDRDNRDRDDRDNYPVRGANGRVEPPSGQFQLVTLGNFLRARVPSNWEQQNANETTVTFAPGEAFYQGQGGSTGFTHGVQIGVMQGQFRDLQEATDQLLQGLQQGNPQMSRQNASYVREQIGGRNGISTTLRNVSEVTRGTEIVNVATVQLRDGSALYVISVAPQEEFAQYQNTFRRMKQSLQINDQQLSQRR